MSVKPGKLKMRLGCISRKKGLKRGVQFPVCTLSHCPDSHSEVVVPLVLQVLKHYIITPDSN